MCCKPICWKHFLYFHKVLYVYCLPILYNKGKPLPIMLNDSYLSNIIRTWNCSKFWLFFITKVSFISLVLSDVKKFRIGFTYTSVITFPYCNYSKKYKTFFSNLQCRICSLLRYISPKTRPIWPGDFHETSPNSMWAFYTSYWLTLTKKFFRLKAPFPRSQKRRTLWDFWRFSEKLSWRYK